MTIAALENLERRLAPVADLLGESWTELRQSVSTVRNDWHSAGLANRDLRIAVVGQVKAGKSSFLNAAIFDGAGVLPKAATPMTAALTVIRYAPQARAEVEFYSVDDWRAIEAQEAEYRRLFEVRRRELTAARAAPAGDALFGRPARVQAPPTDADLAALMPEDLKAARELVTMAHQQQLDLPRLLGTSQAIAVEGDPAALVQRLQEYVGVGGRYTPITKSTTLYYNDERLRGVEIIDTPGMNDPVVSRGQRTRQFLGQCDVVFVLSYAGQFMDLQDLQLLVQHLPAKGVSEVVLVGSQLDSVLLQENRRYRDIGSLLGAMEEKLAEHASSTIERLLAASQSPTEKHVLTDLRAKLPPLFVSSLAFSIARHFGALSAEEAHWLRQYNGMYAGLEFDPALLDDLANFGRVAELLAAQRDKKAAILARRQSDLLSGAQTACRAILEQALRQTAGTVTTLKSESVASLEKQAQDASRRIEAGREGIEGAFEDNIVRMQHAFENVKTELRDLARQYQSLDARSETTTESYQVEKSGFVAWSARKLSLGGYETRSETITTRFALVHEAVDQVTELAIEVEKRLKALVSNAIDLPTFQQDIQNEAMGLFDQGDASFDFEKLLTRVQRTVRRITIPKVEFGDRDYGSMVTQRFSSSRVTENQIDELRRTMKETVRLILQDMERALNAKTAEIVSSMEQAQRQFVKELVTDIEDDLVRLKGQLSQKKETLERLTQAQVQLEASLATL